MVLSAALFFAFAAFLLIAQKAAFVAPQVSAALVPAAAERSLPLMENVQAQESAYAAGPADGRAQAAAVSSVPSAEKQENRSCGPVAIEGTAKAVPSQDGILPEFILFAIAVFIVGACAGYLVRRTSSS